MTTMQWSHEKRKLSDLKVLDKNPRNISKDQLKNLKESLDKFGVCSPLVINTDNTIIGGHQRFQVLKASKKKEVDVYVPSRELTSHEADELNIRLNKNIGEFDIDILANQWEAEDLVEWGFSMEELHLEELPSLDPKEEKASTSCTMTITFAEAEDLQQAENTISTIVETYRGATYRVKIR